MSGDSPSNRYGCGAVLVPTCFLRATDWLAASTAFLPRKISRTREEAFKHGVKLHKKQRLEEAFVQFDEAASLNPQNVEYLAAREAVKAKLVFQHIESGNLLLSARRPVRAAAEFKAAVDLDPENKFARERLQEATREASPVLSNAIVTARS